MIASFLTLIAAGIGFSIRAAILGDWSAQFGFTKQELGSITGGGLVGFGITIIAFPSFSAWGYLGLISPVFVYWLLSRVSGVPLLEESALKRWGEDPEYKTYLENTPVLFPWS